MRYLLASVIFIAGITVGYSVKMVIDMPGSLTPADMVTP